jgi:hypothetical protein
MTIEQIVGNPVEEGAKMKSFGKNSGQEGAAFIKIRAEQRGGQLISEMPRAGGRWHKEKSILTMLRRVEVAVMTAYRWQTMSAIPGPAVQKLEAEMTGEGKDRKCTIVVHLEV